ncbi:hypothetical protein GBAR_LOCUS172, partial [Geodia barretti]
MTSTLVSSVKLLVSPASTQTLTPYYSVKQSSSIMYYVLETKPPSELPSSSPLPTSPTGASTSGERCWLMFVYGVLVGAVVGAGITGSLNLCYLILRKRNIQSNEKLSGEGDEMERNPAYQTSASLIPSSSSNPSYAGLNITANVYE